MRRIISFIMLMLVCLSLNAGNIDIKDIIGKWKLVPGEGVVMAGDILMDITENSISQSLCSTKSGSRNELFSGIYYISDIPATQWDNGKVGKSQSGSYLVRNTNGNIVQSIISFDNAGLLVMTPYNVKNGWTMKFRRMTDDEAGNISMPEDDEMQLMMNMVKLLEQTKNDNTIINNMPGGFFHNMDEEKMKNLTEIKAAGPINGLDIRVFKECCPKLKTLDLSRAWFVSDTVAYADIELPNYTHEFFSNLHGTHTTRERGSVLGLYLELDSSSPQVNVCYDKYGWFVETVKDSRYYRLITTVDDCVNAMTFEGFQSIEKIILPVTTKEIMLRAFAKCPNLKEVTIPANVAFVDRAAFAKCPSLTVVRVAEESTYLLKRLRDDLNSNNPDIFFEHNPKLRIETYKNKRPDVTFTIKGRKAKGKYSVHVSDYSNSESIRELTADMEEFSFEVTVPQYSVIGFNGFENAVIAEGGDVYIDLTAGSVSGTPLNNKVDKFKKEINDARKDIRLATMQLGQYVDEDSISIYKKRLDSANRYLSAVVNKIFLANIDNCLSAYILARHYHDLPLDFLWNIYPLISLENLADPLLRNELGWLHESLRTTEIDCEGYADLRFMVVVKNEKVGGLKSMLTEKQWMEAKRVKVEGAINQADIEFMKELCRRKYQVEALDMSDACIVDENGNVTTRMPEISFAYVGYLKYVALPKNITVIGERCFLDNRIEYIKMYDDVKVIEKEAFANSTALRDFKWPANLERIGEMAFLQCNNLRNVILPGKVMQIDRDAFTLCRNLRTLTIPASTNNIASRIAARSPEVVLSVDAANKNYKVISNVIVGCTDEARGGN